MSASIGFGKVSLSCEFLTGLKQYLTRRRDEKQLKKAFPVRSDAIDDCSECFSDLPNLNRRRLFRGLPGLQELSCSAIQWVEEDPDGDCCP